MYKKTIITVFILAALATFLSSAVAASPKTPDLAVRIYPKVLVKGDEIRLKDIAAFKGPECALKNDLAEAYITKAPKPGQSVTIRPAYIAHRLKKTGLPLDQAKWAIPEKIVAVREYQTVTEDWVREVLKKHLAEREPYKSSRWELMDIRTGSIPKIPVGRISYRTDHLSGGTPSYAKVNIYLTVEGLDVGVVRASGKVSLSVRAVVAGRPLEKGRVIAEGDLKTVIMDADRLGSGSLTAPEQAMGLVCRSRLRMGEPVAVRDFVKADVVKRGDVVTIVAKSGSLRISTVGQAKRDGAVGENIPVVNTKSKKTIIAKVIGPDTVFVNF